MRRLERVLKFLIPYGGLGRPSKPVNGFTCSPGCEAIKNFRQRAKMPNRASGELQAAHRSNRPRDEKGLGDNLTSYTQRCKEKVNL